MQIKIIIVDDNQQIRSLVREILELEDDMFVCAEAKTMQEGQEMVSKHEPDVAIFDLLFDAHKETLFLDEIPKVVATTKVIILSAHSESLYSTKCLKAGAKGYVCKDKVVKSLAVAIRAVYEGKEFVSS
jgi:DNA-binding NarL/FixJ family response regulator